MEAMTDAQLRQYIEEVLNSRESDRAFRLMHEYNVMHRKIKV